MAKGLWLGGLVLIILAQAPLLPAISCNGISPANYDLCMNISKLNLTELEKGLLISNLDYTDKFHPDHNLVYQRNTNIIANTAPNDTLTKDSLFIRNAWVNIFAVMPSILYDGSLYVPNKTAVLCGFNYEIQGPTDYSSPGYPSTSNGDCRRINSLSKNISENKLFVNNAYQGSGRIVNATIASDSEIKAVYDISVEYSIDHYSWNKYCCGFKNKKCIEYCYDCRYNYNEKKKDEISLSDSLPVKYYPHNLYSNIQNSPTGNQISRFRLNYSNSVELLFADSFYSFYKFVYSINYSKPPYYFYTLQAQDYGQESFSNILREGDNFLVKNSLGCTLRSFDFFSNSENLCNLNGENFSFYITTDKLRYIPGDQINVKIYPENITVRLSYNNFTIEEEREYNFTADLSDNKIYAEYNGLYAQKVIFVSKGDKIQIISQLTFLALLIFLIYSYLKKHWRFVT